MKRLGWAASPEWCSGNRESPVGIFSSAKFFSSFDLALKTASGLGLLPPGWWSGSLFLVAWALVQAFVRRFVLTWCAIFRSDTGHQPALSAPSASLRSRSSPSL